MIRWQNEKVYFTFFFITFVFLANTFLFCLPLGGFGTIQYLTIITWNFNPKYVDLKCL